MASTPHVEPEVGPYGWAEFLRLDDEDRRELIDGHLLEIDAPTALHEWIVMVLGSYLTQWTLARSAGAVLASGYKLRVTDHRGVMPDIQFFRTGRKIPAVGLDEGAPDLVVEVISPSSARYDRVRKLEWYASIGVPEYWIVDPEHQILERLVFEQGSYRVAGAFAGEESFSPDSFEGLTVPLAQLWTLPV